MPKVTVVIPSYNHARFLARRLDSVLGQTFRDFEVVFLDDASTDDSRAVFAAYPPDPRVRGVFNDANTGNPFVQWNRGVRMARGEYVWLAESDDDCEPTLLERLVVVLDAHPNVGLAYANSLVVDADGRSVARMDDWLRAIHPTRWQSDFVADGREECRQYLAVGNTIPNASAVLFRRDVFVRAGGADEALRLCGDWATWVRLLAASDVGYVAEPLNRFRAAHSASQRMRTARQSTLIFERLAVLRQIDAAVGVPPDVRDRAVAALADSWLDLARGLDPAEVPGHLQTVVRAVGQDGTDYVRGFQASSLTGVVRAGRDVEALRTDAARAVDELRATVGTIWNNVARLDGRCAELDARSADELRRLWSELDQARTRVRHLEQSVDDLRRSRFWPRLRSALASPGDVPRKVLRKIVRPLLQPRLPSRTG